MKKITVKSKINKPVSKVWDYFTKPEHVTHWNFASEDWFCLKAESNFEIGEKFNYRMEAKDGSFGFDFEGIYDEIILNEKFKYHLADERIVEVFFNKIDENSTEVIEVFDPEIENPTEMQQKGWQMILNNFKNYTEQN